MYRFSFSIIFLLSVCTTKGQAVFTLQQCIDTALANNIPVQQSALVADAALVSLQQSKDNVLPSLNASATHGLNSGRSIDPFTNVFATQNIGSANYGLNTNVILFNGGVLQNAIKQNRFAYNAARMDVQQAKDYLTLNVMFAYLTALNNEDAVSLASQQSIYTQKQLDRLQVLNSQGAIKPSDVSDIKGQLMNDQLVLLNARNELATSKLALLQLMNFPADFPLQIERINVGTMLAVYKKSAEEIYQSALQQFSLIKSVELKKQSSVYALKGARSALYPTISLGANMNTYYSSIASDNTGKKIHYGNQISNNRYSFAGIGISIPVFNSFAVRNRIKMAAIAVRNSQLEERNTKTQLRQQVEQAYLNMNNAYQRFLVLQQQVEAYNASFLAAEVRFNSGVGTTIDYLTAKDRLDRSRTNLINAQYDFVLRTKLLDFYSGKKE